MNKIIIKFIFVFLCINLCPLIANIESSLEIRTAAFFHSSERFRNIYGNVSGSYQLETSTKWNECNCFETFANFDWFSKHGRSKGFKDKTRVNIANISVGIKFPYQLSQCFTAYVGIGPSFSRISIKNHGHCCNHQKVSKLAVGGLLKSGIYYFFNKCVFVDLFVDYLYQPVHFKRHVDIGGLKTGIGIGVKF